jgi:hypothetical protein
LRDCKKVIKTDVLQGWVAFTCAYAFMGQVEDSLKAFKNLMALNYDDGQAINASNALTFLGFHNIVRENIFLSPNKSHDVTVGMIYLAMRSGCIHAAYERIMAGVSMQIVDLKDYSCQIAAHELLLKAGISDEMTSQHMDVAGKVSRKWSISPDVRVDVQEINEVFSGVTLLLSVDLPAVDVFELNLQLAKEEAVRNKKHHAFDIVFVGK